jgi:hypothetical protein
VCNQASRPTARTSACTSRPTPPSGPPFLPTRPRTRRPATHTPRTSTRASAPPSPSLAMPTRRPPTAPRLWRPGTWVPWWTPTAPARAHRGQQHPLRLPAGVGNKADFIVTSVKGPASVQSGQSFTAQVTVCNQGQQGDSTEVGVFLSLTPPSVPLFLPTRPRTRRPATRTPPISPRASAPPSPSPAMPTRRPPTAPRLWSLVPGRRGGPLQLPPRAHREQQRPLRLPAGRGQQGGLRRHLGEGPCQRAVRPVLHRSGNGVQPGPAGREH